MTKPRTVITIVGGGVYAPHLCEALARAIDRPDLELRLSARDPERLRILAAHGGGRVRSIKPGWTVIAAPSLASALEDTSMAILLARVGGFAARAWDEEFPQRFGLVGDEGLGPGGFANAWRTVPALEQIAAAIRGTASGTRVINLMAPLGITTRLLLERGLDAIGLCDLPVMTIQHWLARARAAPAETRWRYGGLNHLGWFWDVHEDGRDVLRLLADQGDIARGSYPIDRATLDHFQAAPLRYFYEIFAPEAGVKLGLKRRPQRAQELAGLAQTLIERFASAPGADHPEARLRPTPWLDLVVAPAAATLLGGPPHTGFANVRNNGQIPELPSELIVELQATFTESGVATTPPGRLPKAVAAFLRQVGDGEMLAYLAAEHRDAERLVEAIRTLPLPISNLAAVELAALAQTGPT
jgi:6-phospho-beta-glucosidase